MRRRQIRLITVAVTGLFLIVLGIGLFGFSRVHAPSAGVCAPPPPPCTGSTDVTALIEAITGLVSALAGLISSVVALAALRHARPKTVEQPPQATDETPRPRLWTPGDGH
jgi:hypothetical protein